MNSLRSIDAIVPFVGHNKPTSFSVAIPEVPILPTIAGTAAFAATLSLSTWVQSLLRVSTGTPRPIPSILGMCTVALASLVSHYVSIESYHQVHSNNEVFDMGLDSLPSLSFISNAPMRIQAVTSSMYNQQSIPMPQIHLDDIDFGHSLRVMVVGLVAFKAFGGRFWSLSPSSYTHLGSFARRVYSLPATDAYATKAERILIKRFGKLAGCHTCGDRMIGKPGLKRSGTKFVADHMPPKSAVKQMNERWYRRLFGVSVKQRFYPQCLNCSLKQSNFLSDASRKIEKAKRKGYILKRVPNLSDSGGGSHAYVHSLRPRTEHFAGGAVASATLVDSQEMDIISGNKIRFRNWQIKAEDLYYETILFLSKMEIMQRIKA